MRPLYGGSLRFLVWRRLRDWLPSGSNRHENRPIFSTGRREHHIPHHNGHSSSQLHRGAVFAGRGTRRLGQDEPLSIATRPINISERSGPMIPRLPLTLSSVRSIRGTSYFWRETET